MRNQFVYTEIVKVTSKEGEEPVEEIRKHSFNVDMVTRAIGQAEGGLLVILDDLHEREEMVRTINQNGKPIMKTGKAIYQSEILLTKEDAERFLEVSQVTQLSHD